MSLTQEPKTDESADDKKYRAFVVNRRLATGLLLAMVALYSLASLFRDRHPALLLLKAFSEAAMIGALADWFAVTALFRHPLGLPIPHTAIIPKNKDRLAEGIGQFLEEVFFVEDRLTKKIDEIDLARLVLGGVVDHDRYVFALSSDLLDAISKLVREQGLESVLGDDFSETFDASILANELLELAVQKGYHQLMMDRFIEMADDLLEDSKGFIRKQVRKKAGDFVPRAVDQRIYKMIFKGLRNYLDDIRDDPQHKARKRFRGFIGTFGQELRASPDLRRQLNQLIAAALRRSLGVQLAQNPDGGDSAARRQMLDGAHTLASNLIKDEVFIQKMNTSLRKILMDLMLRNRERLVKQIADTVTAWSSQELVHRLEVQVGKDLQYIRINGTLMGGIIGLLIHLSSKFFILIHV
jgi:uncharacterized membrane-anchored protein YjiN (DUF445 family)